MAALAAEPIAYWSAVEPVPAVVSLRAASPAAPSASPVAAGVTAAIVIDVVAEKTGYPADVLELDMQLDADLGIDSIKRVEILSALQDRVGSLRSIPPEVLGTLRSLRSIVELVSEPEPAGDESTTAESLASSTTAPAAGASPEIARILLETVADKTGYPAEMLELDMRLDADLGIDSIKRVEIFSAIQDRLPIARAAGPEEIGTLGTLRDIVLFLGSAVGDGAETGNRSRDRRAGRGEGRGRTDRENLARGGGRQDGLSGRYARSGHATRRRPGHRFDQAGRDPLRRAGPASASAVDWSGAGRNAADAAPDRRICRGIVGFRERNRPRA